jgi:DNA-binding LacI/PurR family transcriptional regulator
MYIKNPLPAHVIARAADGHYVPYVAIARCSGMYIYMTHVMESGSHEDAQAGSEDDYVQRENDTFKRLLFQFYLTILQKFLSNHQP